MIPRRPGTTHNLAGSLYRPHTSTTPPTHKTIAFSEIPQTTAKQQSLKAPAKLHCNQFTQDYTRPGALYKST